MKVLIADDWAIFRSGIRQILSDEFAGLEITQMAAGWKHLDLTSGPWDLAIVSVAWRPGARVQRRPRRCS
jgi:DNA-binding NarL/FixJ family response regulator